MRINTRKRELRLKIVFYGPGMSGKTTNLVRLHTSYPAEVRGDLIQLDTDTERTLFFDYFPLAFGEVGGYRIKVDFFTVPGQSFYQSTRRAVLEGADGVVFVADSHPDREEANLLAREDLVNGLKERGRNLTDTPHVYQWNKRDVPGAVPVRALERLLNPEKAPSQEAVAASGLGIWETQSLVLRETMISLRAQGFEAEMRDG